MALFNDKDIQLGYLFGTVVASGNATNVIGGTLTAASWDSDASGVLTFAPPFISAPRIFFSPNTNVALGFQMTGVGVSNVSVRVIMSAATASGGDFNFLAFGLQRL